MAGLCPSAGTVLKVMPCEFFTGACCQRMCSAEGLQWAGHPAVHGTHRLALPSQGAEEMDVNEINKSGTTSSAACLCAQILAAGFGAWFPILVERLAWCGEERAISVSSCYWLDFLLQTPHLITQAHSCRCPSMSNPVAENHLLNF